MGAAETIGGVASGRIADHVGSVPVVVAGSVLAGVAFVLVYFNFLSGAFCVCCARARSGAPRRVRDSRAGMRLVHVCVRMRAYVCVRLLVPACAGLMTPSVGVAYVIAFLLGLSDAVVNTLLIAMLGRVYSGGDTDVFALYYFFKSAFAGVTFACVPPPPPPTCVHGPGVADGRGDVARAAAGTRVRSPSRRSS